MNKTWIQKMDEMLEEEKKNDGLVGFKFSATPSGDTLIDKEDLAKAYVKIQRLRDKGFFKKTTSETL